MIDFVLILLLAVVVGAAGFYIYRARKRGVKCIGCPNGSNCPSCQSKKSSKQDSGRKNGCSGNGCDCSNSK